MANKINIVITAEDKASKPIRNISEEMDGASGKSSKFKSALGALGGALRGAAVAGGIAATALAGTGLALGFNFNSALEQAQTKLSAFMGDNERVAKTLQWVKTEAALTQFSFTEMADAAAQLTPVAKSSGESLEALIKQAEILAALNPAEGLTGAVFSLREALSGDWMSLMDRFNIPRTRINQLKAQGVPAMKIISTVLGEMGIKYDLVAKQGQTVSARWDQITDKLNMMAGAATKPIFDRVSKELDNLADFDYEGVGEQLGNIVAGAIKGLDDFVGFTRDTIAAVRRLPGEISSAVRAGAENVATWAKEQFETVQKAVGSALDWIGETAEETWSSFTGWVEKNKTAIIVVSSILGTIFGPALIRATVLATISGVKIAASGAAAGAGWIAASAKATASWLVASARWVAVSAVSSVKMVAHAVAVGAAHSLQAVKASAVWIANFARLVVVSSASSVKMALHAADVGWAWLLNGTRVTFAWVTQTLPKIIFASAATAVAASRHALATGAAWIAAAARAAFAWVVTELPKIVTSFIATSASASSNALVSSGAWIAAATKSAVAWVVTELPKIVAAFVTTSGAAIAQAAIASAAWVASATTSSASFGALSALVTTPLVMPAIAVAAAIASLVAVQDAANKAMAAVEQATKAKEDANNEELRMTQVVIGQYKRGEISKEQYDKMIGIINKKYASGTNASVGGSAWVGEHGPELVRLPQGASVTPAYRSRQEGAGGGPTVYIENLNNNYPNDQGRLIRDIGFALELAS